MTACANAGGLRGGWRLEAVIGDLLVGFGMNAVVLAANGGACDAQG